MLDRRCVKDPTIAIALMAGTGEACNATPVAIRAECSKANRRQRRANGIRSYANFGAVRRDGSISETAAVCSPYPVLLDRVLQSLYAGG